MSNSTATNIQREEPDEPDQSRYEDYDESIETEAGTISDIEIDGYVRLVATAGEDVEVTEVVFMEESSLRVEKAIGDHPNDWFGFANDYYLAEITLGDGTITRSNIPWTATERTTPATETYGWLFNAASVDPKEYVEDSDD